jgi:two-component system, OmpR family, sensor histidine kinase CreC
MPDADRACFVGNIVRETQRIQELVDRMMELTALESRRSLDETAAIPLRTLMEDLAASAQASGAARGVTVELAAGEDATVEGDAFLLRRALANLIDNALDFSPANGQIELTLTLHPRSVDLSVRDHGPGIPDYAEDKVFEKFYSLARPHSRKKSTGLGLPFVKEIAELHHGRVTLTNAPQGGGAVATLSLPRAVVAA